MKYLILLALFFSSLFSSDELVGCVQTDVSKTSVIFTCMHGEYYVEYESVFKKEVKGIKILYTESEKYKYLKNLKKFPKDIN